MIQTDVSATIDKRCFYHTIVSPLPSTPEEKELFKTLQGELKLQFENIFPDRLAPKTVVIVPSLTLDREILTKVYGHVYY